MEIQRGEATARGGGAAPAWGSEPRGCSTTVLIDGLRVEGEAGARRPEGSGLSAYLPS
jgi:hypothetical protein